MSTKGIGLLDSVITTLEKQPAIHLGQQDVEQSRGKLQQESGQFDTTLDATLSHDHADVPLTELDVLSGESPLTDTTTAQMDLSKQFRTGVTVNPSVQVVRTEDTPSLFNPSNAATVNFTISIPLLKGLGTKATGANELAARWDLQAGILTLRHTLSQQVLSTVTSYWDYLAAARVLDLRRISEKRAKESYSDTRKLIQGDEKAASEIELVSANLASKTAARIEAERALVIARHALGLAMGLLFQEIDSLPLPVDDFPRAGDQAISKVGSGAALKLFTDRSLENRADYLASKESQESAKVLVEQARNGLLPQLDFQVGVGYSGLDEGSRFSNFGLALRDNIPGYSATASLTYKWPFKNNTARGLFLQSVSTYRKTVISTDDLARNIDSKVVQDISDLMKSSLELAGYYKSVGHYKKAVENEGKKFHLGMSTLVELFTTEDNLITAQLSLISAQVTHAKALAQLRFDTGTLLADREERIQVGVVELTTIPFIDGSER